MVQPRKQMFPGALPLLTPVLVWAENQPTTLKNDAVSEVTQALAQRS